MSEKQKLVITSNVISSTKGEIFFIFIEKSSVLHVSHVLQFRITSRFYFSKFALNQIVVAVVSICEDFVSLMLFVSFWRGIFNFWRVIWKIFYRRRKRLKKIPRWTILKKFSLQIVKLPWKLIVWDENCSKILVKMP